MESLIIIHTSTSSFISGAYLIIMSARKLQQRSKSLFIAKPLLNSRMPRHSCCEVCVMQMHDILQMRTSAILPEAISDGGLTPIWYNTVNDSQNIFYRRAFKNGIDFTKRQFSKKLICKKLISPTVHILPCSRILPHSWILQEVFLLHYLMVSISPLR